MKKFQTLKPLIFASVNSALFYLIFMSDFTAVQHRFYISAVFLISLCCAGIILRDSFSKITRLFYELLPFLIFTLLFWIFQFSFYEDHGSFKIISLLSATGIFLLKLFSLYTEKYSKK